LERIEISHRTIIFAVLFAIFIWFLYQIKSVLLLLFIVVILTAALSPIVDCLEKIKIHRSLAILLIYFLIIGGLFTAFYAVIPPVAEQSISFFNTLPQILKETGVMDNVKPDMFVSEFTSIPGNVLRFLLSAFSNLLAVFAILVLTFYTLLEKKNLPSYLAMLFRDEEKEKMAGELVDPKDMADKAPTTGGWVPIIYNEYIAKS